jgi:hypothetical protein
MMYIPPMRCMCAACNPPSGVPSYPLFAASSPSTEEDS